MKVKFSPILSRSGNSLAISSISGRALANLSVDKTEEFVGENRKAGGVSHSATGRKTMLHTILAH